MATVIIKVDGRGLLNYSRAGRDAFKEVNKVVRQVLNIGRKEARQRISSEFQVRTGLLRRQARRMQAKSFVTNAEVRGRVTPIPNLMNIFENGATLANGRGYLRPRPVITPAGAAMEREAPKLFNQILQRIGK
jgi:hypothetical protein